MAITQHNRTLQIESSPLGKDVLLLEAFQGREALSELFTFELELLSEKGDIDPKRLVGKSLTFSLQLADGGKRHFNGQVRRFSRGPAMANSGARHYRAELVPWLWFLTRRSNCRIFSQKSVKDIIEKVFRDSGFTQFKFQLSAAPAKREYCVQYRETDFAFVSRLMEEQGLFYYFQHQTGKHELVVADAATAYQDCPEKQIEYFPGDKASDRILGWDHNYEFRSGKWAQNDYNFETPSNTLATESKTLHGMDDADKYTLYDYPGGYLEKPAGDTLARTRMEEEEVAGDTATAQSTCRTLHPAGRFTLQAKEDAPQDHGAGFAIIAIEHAASDRAYGQGGGGGLSYDNHFTCIPAKTVFRPAHTTPRPSVQGLESAVVVGPDKDTVHTDKYGRIKVKFHWDREDKSESCWIRTSQSLAGSGWGALFLPRVGQEVVVSFLGGDPDRPIVTGSVYNAEQMPPYTLPDEASQSGLKTRSWPHGEADMFNELRFDDKKDSEAVFFQAQKDFNRAVKHDDSLKVDNDRTVEIKKNLTSTISEGNETHSLKQGNRSVTLDQGNDTLKLQAGNRTVNLDKGNHSLKLSAGKATTEAMQGIELKVGANSIKIDQSGITIKGMQVKIQGDTMVDLKGPMAQVSGDGMLTLKGGVVMIN